MNEQNPIDFSPLNGDVYKKNSDLTQALRDSYREARRQITNRELSSISAASLETIEVQLKTLLQLISICALKQSDKFILKAQASKKDPLTRTNVRPGVTKESHTDNFDLSWRIHKLCNTGYKGSKATVNVRGHKLSFFYQRCKKYSSRTRRFSNDNFLNEPTWARNDASELEDMFCSLRKAQSQISAMRRSLTLFRRYLKNYSDSLRDD